MNVAEECKRMTGFMVLALHCRADLPPASPHFRAGLAIAVDEFLLWRHLRHCLGYRLPDRSTESAQVRVGHGLRQRVVLPGHDALTEHYVRPGIHPEKFVP
jgi:hypothetical protein